MTALTTSRAHRTVLTAIVAASLAAGCGSDTRTVTVVVTHLAASGKARLEYSLHLRPPLR